MTITTLPTRTSGSIGATKTDYRPPTGQSYEWKAAEVNETLDRIVELYGEVGLSDGSTAGSLNERVTDLESSITAPLAEWNGTNLSQFSAAITSGFTSPSFAVYTSGSRKVIQFTATAASAGALAFLNFSAAIPVQDMSGRAWVGIPVRTAGDDVLAGLTAGFVSAAPSPDWFGLLHMTGINASNASQLMLAILNGTDPPEGTPLATGSGVGPLSFDLRWASNGTDPPSYSTEFGVPASRVSAFTNYSPPSPVASSAWVGETPNRAGLVVFSFAGCLNPIEVWFWDVKFEAR